MLKIYHNPRCRKSREGLQLLEDNDQEFQVIKYLDKPLNENELTALLQKLQLKPIELVRTKEKIWKENFKGKDLSDKEIIKAMADYPKLMERPIVESDKQAVVGRPTEKIKELI